MKTGKHQSTNDLYKIAIVGLVALLAINFGGDYVFRGGQIEINEAISEVLTMQAEWNTMQAEWNTAQSELNILVAEALIGLDKDVRSNMKVVDQLIGIILRNGEV